MKADRLLLVTVLVATWHRVAWVPLGRLTLADILQVVFVGVLVAQRVARRDPRVASASLVTLGFGLAFAVVYLAGAVTVNTNTNAVQLIKGLVVWAVHWAFLVAMVEHLARRGAALFRRGVRWFVAGFVVNAAYGLVQYAAQTAGGVNLDAYLINPFFPGSAASGLNYYGTVTTLDQNGGLVQTSVLRVPALTNDPNHLGVLLVMPIMILVALAAWRRLAHPIIGGLVVAGLLVVVVLTESRSGLLGLAAGAGLLVVVAGRRLVSHALLVPAGIVGAGALLLVATRLSYVIQVLESRTQTSGSSFALHTQVYGFIPTVLSTHPLFGIGLNGFAEAFAWQTGRSGFGPHSAFVQILTETGLVGMFVFAGFVGWVLVRVLARRSEPLAAGLAAAVVGTLVANIFYLTTVFPSWTMLLGLALVYPIAIPRGTAPDAVAVLTWPSGQAPGGQPWPAGQG